VDQLLLADVPIARQALRKLLPEPLKIAPVTIKGHRTLSFEGVTTLGPILDLALLPSAYKGLASPRGFARYISRIELPCDAWLQAA